MIFHEPVLLREVLEVLGPVSTEAVVDGTCGTGGHARELFRRVLPGGRLYCLDRDPQMLAIGAQRLKDEFRNETAAMSFHAIPYEKAGEVVPNGADVILIDAGFNSLQIEHAERGFSFLKDGPLDARFNPADGSRSVATLVNESREEDLARWFHEYGEERHARKAARAIVARRRVKPFERTTELAELMVEVYPPKDRFGRIHPATRVFQSLRIVANDELGHVERGVRALIGLLNPGGRLACISFHSLEDRIVKQAFDEVASPRPTPDDPYSATSSEGIDFEIPSRRAIACSDEEAESNPRARSAKLRVIRRKGGK